MPCRAALQTEYPAAFQLIAAMNPCPCGRLGDSGGDCRCTPAEVQRYRARISGPLLDRLDMQVEVPRVSVGDFEVPAACAETTAAAAGRIARARSLALERQAICNARGAMLVRTGCGRAARTGGSNAAVGILRTRTRLLKVARTIADLEGAQLASATHVGEAVMLRCMDRGATAPSAPCDRRPA